MEIYLHDGSNVITINSLNTIIANAREEFKLGEDTMSPIYDDYNDDYECFTPTITKKDFTYVEINNNTFMHVNHDKNALYDTYIVQFVYDGTEIYYERGKHVSKYLNNTMFPLFMLKVLMLHLLCLSMLLALFSNDLFSYKMPMHRKRVRLKCV